MPSCRGHMFNLTTASCTGRRAGPVLATKSFSKGSRSLVRYATGLILFPTEKSLRPTYFDVVQTLGTILKAEAKAYRTRESPIDYLSHCYFCEDGMQVQRPKTNLSKDNLHPHFRSTVCGRDATRHGPKH